MSSKRLAVSSRQSGVGRRATGGEEGHVAIPSVTYTSNLMYHLKAEKALSGYN
ncbi:MAG: hypothetical protein GXO97_07770 [Nitrospirae bacterium]|nr:hypothetical protein [Nitrospirota bacterium]